MNEDRLEEALVQLGDPDPVRMRAAQLAALVDSAYLIRDGTDYAGKQFNRNLQVLGCDVNIVVIPHHDGVWNINIYCDSLPRRQFKNTQYLVGMQVSLEHKVSSTVRHPDDTVVLNGLLTIAKGHWEFISAERRLFWMKQMYVL